VVGVTNGLAMLAFFATENVFIRKADLRCAPAAPSALYSLRTGEVFAPVTITAAYRDSKCVFVALWIRGNAALFTGLNDEESRGFERRYWE
jgi:hypothetical protein